MPAPTRRETPNADRHVGVSALPADVTAACAEFASQHPQYADAHGAADMCQEASAEFLDLLIESGVLAPDGIQRSEWENAEAGIVDGYVHYAARVGPWLIDWTARQFDPEAPWPLVAPV